MALPLRGARFSLIAYQAGAVRASSRPELRNSRTLQLRSVVIVRYPLPPGPRGRPPLGDLPAFARAPLDFLSACAHYGPIVGLRFAHRRVYLLNEPELVDQVLTQQAANFIKSTLFYRHLSALFGQGLLTSEGEFWRRRRRLVAPAFQSERLAGYGEIMARYARQMMQDWRPGELRNVHQDMMALTMRIVAKTLFDAELGGEVEVISRTFTAVVEEISARLLRPFVIPAWVPTPGARRYRRGVQELDRLVYRLLRERRERGIDRGDLLSLLLAARDEDGRPLGERQLRDELVTLFLGGHETTAVTLSWAWHLLSGRPAALARLREELQTVLRGRPPGVDDVARLRYSEGVIKESLRLFPPAWGIAREATRSCDLGGYRLPAGATVAISPWLLHRDPRYFEQPDAFRPERWSPAQRRRLPRSAFLPFGGGPRSCIGQRFAMLEAMLALATVAQRFQPIRPPAYSAQPLASITLRPANGVRLIMAAPPAADPTIACPRNGFTVS